MYYLFIDNQQRGPYSLEQLAELGITPETEVWTEGMSDWQQAGDVPALTTLLQRLEYERHAGAANTPPQPPMRQSAQPVPPSWQASAQPTTPPPSAPAPRRRNNGWLIGLLILAIVLGVLVVTCPDRKAHIEAITNSTREWVGDKTEAYDVNDLLGELIKWVTGQGVDRTLDQVLVVDNYIVCSVGKIPYADKPKTVSVGILGHVFTFSKEDIDKELERRTGIDLQAQQPSVGITPPPADDPLEEDLVAPDDTLGSVMPREDDEPYDPTRAMLDTLAKQAKDQAIKVAKEWAKKQIDNL